MVKPSLWRGYKYLCFFFYKSFGLKKMCFNQWVISCIHNPTPPARRPSLPILQRQVDTGVCRLCPSGGVQDLRHEGPGHAEGVPGGPAGLGQSAVPPAGDPTAALFVAGKIMTDTRSL